MAGDFSDEEWDISDDQLQVLEQNAILSTQQQNDRQTKTTSINNNTSLVDAQRSGAGVRHRVVPTARTRNPRDLEKETRFDSPSLDEDGIPLVVEQQRTTYVPIRKTDETTQREQWRVNRFGPSHAQKPTSNRPIPHQADRHLQQHSQRVQPADQVSSVSSNQTSSVAVNTQDATRAKIDELLRERDLLKKNLDNVTTQLHTARGENVVVRSKGADDLKLAERQIQILKKQMQEETQKHQATLQSKEASYNKLITDSNFLKHELDEQSRKVRALQIQIKDKPPQDHTNGIGLSPRKMVASNLRDGFDDEELMHMSPGRSPAKGTRSKPGTPTNRKRKQADINAAPLPLKLTGEVEHVDNASKTANKNDPVMRVVKNAEVERHLKFVQDVLNFHPFDGQDTSIEALMRFSFPSDSERPLSSSILMEISKLHGSHLPGDLLECFATLLSRCAQEEYYKPLSLLLAIINQILDLEPSIIDAGVLRSLLPPLQSLVEVNARRRWVLADLTKIWDSKIPRPSPDPHIDTARCLDLLVVVANLVSDENDLIKLFWSTLTTDFILIMATPIHPIKDLTLVLELLETSILETTFGNICSPEAQAAMEIYVIDKICFLLWEPPRHMLLTRQDKKAIAAAMEKSTSYRRSKPKNQQSLQTSPAPTRLEICNLRLATLSLLSKFVVTSIPHPHKDPELSSLHHGTNIGVTHPKLVARLTRSIYDELTSLYAHHPDTHELHATLVNRATAILHHILMSAPAKTIDLPQILAGTSVGTHKFRVAMCRIALREGLAGGIDEALGEETVVMAREILGEYVAPDEAVQLLEAFGKSLEEEGDVDVDAEEEETLAAQADESEMMDVVHID